jgi:hypothetical protein
LGTSVAKDRAWAALAGSGVMARQVPFMSRGCPVCTENLIRVDDVMESPKLAE